MKVNQASEIAEIIDTTADGKGVADVDGKRVFVQGALTGETVQFLRRKKRRKYDEATLVDIITASPERTEPVCSYFDFCGGCSLQHLEIDAQVRLKQLMLLESLRRIGAVQPGTVLAPITGSSCGYRRKARLAVKYVEKKERVLVGFRERNKPYVTDMDRCETLHPAAGDLIADLAGLVGRLTLRNRVPQIEVAVGDNVATLVFRILDPLTPADVEILLEFQADRQLQILLQTGGPGTIIPLRPDDPVEDLYYRIPRFDLEIGFAPTDFVQVHAGVNLAMIDQALDLLALDDQSRVLDMYCGVGNFTLPIARVAGHVVGIEGEVEMVERARSNARRNEIQNAEFRQADLSRTDQRQDWQDERFDALVLDPPRAGAGEVIEAVSTMNIEKILYVSCHPGTLARDAKVLVEAQGYELVAAGIMDMFPHTSHVESMALFEKR